MAGGSCREAGGRGMKTRSAARKSKRPVKHSRAPRANTSTIGAMRISDVSLELLVSESMVRSLIDRGELHAGCIGKRKIIFREDLEAFKAKLRGIEGNSDG